MAVVAKVAANVARASATVLHAPAHHARAVSPAHVVKVAARALRVRSSASAVQHQKRVRLAHLVRRALMDSPLASHALAKKAHVTAAHAVAQVARDLTHSQVRAERAMAARTQAMARADKVHRNPHVQVAPVVAIAKAIIARVTHVTRTATSMAM